MSKNKQLAGEEFLTEEDYEKVGSTIAKPKAEKKPRNGLFVALVSFNFAFFVVDIISAGVVGYLTYWYYGVATLIAGAVFMFIHEYLFTRPFNNVTQKNISIGGAAWAVLTILFIAVVSVVANLTGLMTAGYEQYFMALMVGIIVTNIVIHGVLTGVFYYVDDQHKAKNKSARARARAITQNEIDDAAEMILTEALRRRIARRSLVSRFKNKESIKKAIIEAGGDEDGDGIPDFMDPIDNRTGKPFQQAARSYAADTDAPKESNPTKPPRKE